MDGVSALTSPAPAGPGSTILPPAAPRLNLSAPAIVPVEITQSTASLTFKVAAEPWEFEQIHRLNYRTFVEEIPQHQRNAEGILIDKYHHENTYVICLEGQRLLGMMALRSARPFSLDSKLPNLDSYLPAGVKTVAEVRLLAAEKDVRGTRVFPGLMGACGEYLAKNGVDLVVISGATRQARLYRHMGFEPFAHLVGTPGAMFQPMYITRDRFRETARTHAPQLKTDDGFGTMSFLPGPVDITPEVRRALASLPVSHRADAFLEDFRATQESLRALVNAKHVQILTGSGTLANDVVAAQLSLLPSRGLILSNGEFGDRLIDHGRRMGLNFTAQRRAWGTTFDSTLIHEAMDADPSIGWIWAVHSETSTGVLNDMAMLKGICRRRGFKLALDCISSIGTMPVDLADVYLASGISGKGLRGFPGLSLVFHDQDVAQAPERLPRYLDLGYYAEKDGVPFTICSNLLYAMKTAVEQVRAPERYEAIAEHSRYIRAELSEIGLVALAPAEHAAPAVITIPLPRQISAIRVGDRLADAGFLLSYKSDYLLSRNWVQICLMGRYTRETVDNMMGLLKKHAVRRDRHET